MLKGSIPTSYSSQHKKHDLLIMNIQQDTGISKSWLV